MIPFARILMTLLLTLLVMMPSPAQEGAPATLTGVVTDQDGYPISSARITVDSGQVGHADHRGEFSVSGIPPGPHHVTIRAPGHHVGGKTIEFVGGQAKSLRVTLTSDRPSSRHQEEKPRTSTLYVTVHPYRSGGLRYGVKQVEVYGYNDPSKHWNQYCWTGRNGPMTTVTCSNATLGETYVVHVTWKHRPDDDIPANDETSSTFYRKFTSPYQTETFYNP